MNKVQTANHQVGKTKQKFSQIIQGANYQKLMLDTLGDEKAKQRFQSSIMSAVAINPKLQECESGSILTAGLQGEALKLSPSPQMGHYYMVPFNNTKQQIKQAQFQMGWKGYVQLAIRSGQYDIINAISIKEGEEFNFNRLTEEFNITKWIEDDNEREKAKTVGYVATLKLINGFSKTIYWSLEKMEAHADKWSTAFNLETQRDIEQGKIPQKDMWKYSSFWYKNFDEMALKTMLRQLISKWGIMSVEMEKAFNSDMAVIQEDGSIYYVDNEPDLGSTKEVIEQKEVVIDEVKVEEEIEEVDFNDF